MKSITSLKYILVGTVLLSTSACKEFLKEEPEGFIKTDNYYKTEADAVNSVSAIYYLLNSGGNGLQTPYNTLFNTGLNFMADDEFPGPGATQPDVRSMAGMTMPSIVPGMTVLRMTIVWCSALSRSTSPICSHTRST